MGKVNRTALTLAILSLTATGTGAERRRLPLPNPVLFMYGYADALSGVPQYWRDSAQFRAYWEMAFPVFNVIDGVTSDANLVKRLRSQGKVFAYHVSNNLDDHHKMAADMLAEWSKPFENTLGGELAGGFDAICIDEFHSYPDGDKDGQISLDALKELREKYPDRLIFASGVFTLADGGPLSLSGKKQTTYDDTLKAMQKYADIFLLENYHRTGNPQLEYFPAMAKNVEDRVPGLLKKTIYILFIPQTPPFDADDDPAVDFFNFLELQINLIKIGPLTKTMPGIGFWIFYRAKPETIPEVIRLTQEHYR